MLSPSARQTGEENISSLNMNIKYTFQIILTMSQADPIGVLNYEI